MARQRQIMAGGWKSFRFVVAKKFKVKFTTKEEGSGNGPLTKAQAQAVRDLIRSKLSNNEKNITKLSSEVKALSKRGIYSAEEHRKDLLKNTESAKLESFKNSLAILVGAGSMLVSAVAIALSMHH